MQVAGVVGFLLGLIASRVVHERAYRRLGDEHKLRLMDGFSASRAYSLIPLAAMFLGFYALQSRGLLPEGYLLGLFWAAIALYVAGMLTWQWRRLRRLELPPFYQRAFALSQALSLGGATCLIATTLLA